MEIIDIFNILSIEGHVDTFDLSPLIQSCKGMFIALDTSADLTRWRINMLETFLIKQINTKIF